MIDERVKYLYYHNPFGLAPFFMLSQCESSACAVACLLILPESLLTYLVVFITQNITFY
jgi:hypothetical protein